jgi:hypothetical protein
MTGRDISDDIRIETMSRGLKTRLMQLLLDQFAVPEIKCALRNKEHVHSFSACVELEKVVSALATVYPELQPLRREIGDGLDKVHRANRTMLLKDYLQSRDPAEINSLSEILQRCIAADPTWDWEAEYDKAIAKGGLSDHLPAFA